MCFIIYYSLKAGKWDNRQPVRASACLVDLWRLLCFLIVIVAMTNATVMLRKSLSRLPYIFHLVYDYIKLYFFLSRVSEWTGVEEVINDRDYVIKEV